MSAEPTSLGPNWWTSLTHGGLLMAPAMVEKSFSHDLPALEWWRADTLRRALTRRAETGVRQLLDTVFLQVLGHDPARWNRNPPSEQWSRRLLTGESERPDRLLKPVDGADSQAAFPVFVEKPDVRLGYHRGRQSVARVVEWLRKANLKLALLATEQQWRLIYAGSDFEAWCEWNLDLWFESGQPALQVEALRRLLDPAAAPLRILDAIEASRRGQAELTSVLGERVRQAVEKLIQSSAANLETLDVSPSDIYLAATRMIMRCVVALFAEGKGMLGRDMPAYHDSYGVQGLREQLERISRGRPEALHDLCFGWPRLIALFRLIHAGSAHPQIVTTRYGGTLFEPGESTSSDPILRAVAALETAYPCPRDRDVYEILLLLTRTYVKVSQGRGARAVPTPVDFSNLDTEYMGILYEGLLDYDLKRAAGEPVVFLRMGDEPALSVSDLETIPANKLKDVFGKLMKKSQLAVMEDGDSGDDGAAADDADEDPTSADDEAGEVDEISAEPVESEVDLGAADDEGDAAVDRAREWARQAVRAAGMVRAPRRQTEETRRRYEDDVEAEAKTLFSRIVRPGEWYLVRFGNTRKGSGTFYTRKELASPTVRRTLAPLVRDDAGDPRKPEEILAVKVCDPAVGSGSFLISVLRYMTAALFESLYLHGRIQGSGGNKYFDLGIGPPDHLPDNEDFDSHLQARLRRFVVERCLYGVDLNPLAIELARMSLWIETMDPRLPFGFLDHKLKAGNSLVGCWFDRFEDYPVMAWMREGGDKDYEPVNPRPNWSKQIAAELRDRVKPNVVRMIESGAQQHLPLSAGKAPVEIFAEVRGRLNHLHELTGDPDQQRLEYAALRDDAGFQRLRLAFDLWCALWFWAGDELRKAPIAADFLNPSDDAIAVTQRLRNTHRFFHWELEFPDVFSTPSGGFDAVVGNPPWEIQKPNSKEFFSNIDPLYRTYGKQEGLRRQREVFRKDGRHEDAWISERARLKSLSGWIKFAAFPFGDRKTDDADRDPKFDCPLGRGFDSSQDLHRRWKHLRRGRTGFSDCGHPFAYQGSADLNTYKMFLEMGYRLLGDSGRLGMIVPSGVYSDQGSTALRTLFLENSSWEWLFSFENREKIFDIDSRFKFNPVIVRKGGRTTAIRTGFMHHRLKDWEEAELHALDYPGQRVSQFSPISKALLEIRSGRDLELTQNLFDVGSFLGPIGEAPWNIQCKREFHMTDDVRSGLLRTRSSVESACCIPDVFGNWLRGNWVDRESGSASLNAVPSFDGTKTIALGQIDEVFFPLYQGVMIDQLNPFASKFTYTSATRGKWLQSGTEQQVPVPKYLMSSESYRTSEKRVGGLRLLYRVQGGATNWRTAIGCLVDNLPFGNSLNSLVIPGADSMLLLCAAGLFTSFSHDWLIREKLAGTNLNAFYLSESVLPKIASGVRPHLGAYVALLNLKSSRDSATWLSIRKLVESHRHFSFRGRALTRHERLRLSVCLDAVSANLMGFSYSDFSYVLRNCDFNERLLAEKAFTRRLDPKGFWRVEQDQPPQLRHTVLSLIAFHDLERLGLAAFLALNDGEGWMIPDKIRLADYGLGQDDFAKEHQPVASVLGPRFYDWQLVQSVEESWEECARHAELLARIVAPPHPVEPDAGSKKVGDSEDRPVNLFGEPVATDLFGNLEYPAKGGRRR